MGYNLSPAQRAMCMARVSDFALIRDNRCGITLHNPSPFKNRSDKPWSSQALVKGNCAKHIAVNYNSIAEGSHRVFVQLVEPVLQKCCGKNLDRSSKGLCSITAFTRSLPPCCYNMMPAENNFVRWKSLELGRLLAAQLRRHVKSCVCLHS